MLAAKWLVALSKELLFGLFVHMSLFEACLLFGHVLLFRPEPGRCLVTLYPLDHMVTLLSASWLTL